MGKLEDLIFLIFPGWGRYLDSSQPARQWPASQAASQQPVSQPPPAMVRRCCGKCVSLLSPPLLVRGVMAYKTEVRSLRAAPPREDQNNQIFKFSRMFVIS